MRSWSRVSLSLGTLDTFRSCEVVFSSSCCIVLSFTGRRGREAFEFSAGRTGGPVKESLLASWLSKMRRTNALCVS